MPGLPGAHEYLTAPAGTGAGIETAGGTENQILIVHGRGRSAPAAERALSLRGLVGRDPLLAIDPAETLLRHRDERGEDRAVVPAAHRAVAVIHLLEGTADLESHGTAEARAVSDVHVVRAADR